MLLIMGMKIINVRILKKRGTLIVTCSTLEAFELAQPVRTSNEDPTLYE